MRINVKKAGAAALLCAVALTTTQCRQSNQAQLQLRLQSGKTYNFRITSDQKINQTLMGQQQNVNQKLGITYGLKVNSVDPSGVMAITATYNTVQFQQNGPMGQTVEYDSTKGNQANNPMTQGFAMLVGKSFSMQVAPDGTVKSVQGMDQMIEQMFQSLNLPSAQIKEAVIQNFKDQFGDQTLKEMMEKSLKIYPDRPVKVGDSWQRQMTFTKGVPIVIDNTWTLKELKGNQATIDVSSKVTPNPKAPPMKLNPIEMRYSLSGNQQGTLQVDQQAGIVTQSQMTQKMSGEMEVTGVPNTPGPIKVPMTLESTIVMETVK